MIYLPLLFHFNQHLNEMSALASQVCYRGLLQTLRANPAIKANIHISGTLLTALKWLDPTPLILIREGLADGQFEIVGSTFAQNVPYASDDWDNARQIELHRKIIEETFGITPTTFWNSERCWRQSLVPVIAGGGYNTITLEDHILFASGGHSPNVYSTRQGEHTLHIIRDDEKLKHLFNFAAWFGDSHPLHRYLDKLSLNRDIKEIVLAYAEDAEAMGLWGYFQGVIPNQTWDRLDRLLKSLTTRSDIKTIHFSEIPSPAQEITPIADGSAAWMNASLAKEGLPYHEDGYRDWFDFNARSPKLAKFRQFYADIRQHLQTAGNSTEQKRAQKIYDLALHSYLTHQYEFGCIGIGGDDYRGWLGANAARVLASSVALAALTKRSQEPVQFTIVEELSRDGVQEWIHIKQNDMLITSPVGGRLLFWLNLKQGQMLVGNPSAVVRGKYEGYDTPPSTVTYPSFWLPDASSYTNHDQPEPPPTRLAKFLPEWIWEETDIPLTLAVREMRLTEEQTELTAQPLAAQQGAFCDEIWIDNQLVSTRRDTMEAEGSREAIRFIKQFEHISFRKKYTLNKNKTLVTYTLTNTGDKSCNLRLMTTSELALDYDAILHHGRVALEFLPEQPGVINPLTGETLTITATRNIEEIIRIPMMLGLGLGLGFTIDLPAHHEEKFSLQLTYQSQ